ncbi:MAG TPA: serine hydrolase domain-containing protein [Nevskia sp.]|nr:serine hydrolase domain-containing protein [Nevskia sp.]
MVRTLLQRRARHSISVPRDLRPLTTVDRDGETFAPAAGLALEDKRAIWQAVQAVYRSGAHPAMSLCLRRRGRIVFNRSIGHVFGGGPRDHRDAHKMLLTPDMPVCLFSASKAVTAILAHKLAEQGGIDLDVPVKLYIPEFAQAGKGGITVSDVLSHRGGFPSIALPKAERRVELLNDWDRVIDLICRAPQTHGRQLAYHAITGGFILAEIIQRVTGKPLRDYLDRELRRPLGMTHFTYGIPEAHRDRVAVNYVAGPPVRFPLSKLVERALLAPFDEVVAASNSQTFMDAVIPAGNIYATAEELSRFFQMLLDGGTWNGRRILREKTVARAVAPRGRMTVDRMLMVPMRYSEGMMLGADPFGLYGPDTGRAYGHLGFINILGWADPQRGISAALLTTGKAILGRHLVALGRLMQVIARRCE